RVLPAHPDRHATAATRLGEEKHQRYHLKGETGRRGRPCADQRAPASAPDRPRHTQTARAPKTPMAITTAAASIGREMRVQLEPNQKPARASIAHQGRAPTTVRTANGSRRTRARPAAKEM